MCAYSRTAEAMCWGAKRAEIKPYGIQIHNAKGVINLATDKEQVKDSAQSPNGAWACAMWRAWLVFSLSSVSLVAADRPGVSEEIRARTLGAISRLGYVPPPRPRRETARYTLAVISEQLLQPIELDIFYAEILQGIQTEAQGHGHLVLLHLLAGGEGGVRRLLDSVRGEMDGMLLV